MADDSLNILEWSLAARHESCMADPDHRFLGSVAATGHGRLMAVANPTPRKHCQRYQEHQAFPYLNHG
ncbi:hypothetical protein E2C01_093849 [Portunus trituberculatus]|uniref:Uncharacterized protein n=1 Tax=Portunus trituberculatus TaxID=210409 RepID=A0A5B7JVY9_PORTR|nr:hypothetical protein [Portunus trituberculatus]